MKCFYKAGEKDKYMMNIFKRKQKPLIIAPPYQNFYVPGSHKTIIQTASASDTFVIYEPKTVSEIERILEHQQGISKCIKIVDMAGNFEVIADALRNKGYEVKEG